jgi:molybdopterin molybdotransferase
LFAVPLIRRLFGRADLMPVLESARLGAPLPANDERADYLRARLSGENGVLIATPFNTQDSSMLANLANADCLVVREPFAPPAAQGSPCSIVKLGF